MARIAAQMQNNVEQLKSLIIRTAKHCHWLPRRLRTDTLSCYVFVRGTTERLKKVHIDESFLEIVDVA